MSNTRGRALTALLSAGALALSLLPSGPALGLDTATSPAATTAAAAPSPGAAGVGDAAFPLYGNGGYNVSRYDVRVRYNPATDILAGQTHIKIRATQDLSRFNLDLVGLTVRWIKVDNVAATWVRRSGHELVITPRKALAKGAAFTVVVSYDGKPSRFTPPSGGSYGFLTTHDGAVAVGQPESAAFWYPVNDHPRDKATYRISLTVPAGLQAISNGLPQPTTTSKGWATTVWGMEQPMASYLSFMAVGHFTVHRWRTPSGLTVIDAVDPSLPANVRASINATLAQQAKILSRESAWFGPYPYTSAGGLVDAVNVGFALENQTRPIYSSGFWGDREQSYQNDGVVVHELAHQWFGDSISLHRWKDIWLNEGFATYAEWLWAGETGGPTPAQIFADLNDNIPAGDGFWTTPPGAPGVPDLFSQAVYTRGAMTLQALRQVVGDKAFFSILQTWSRTRRNGQGTTAQFVTLAEKISGRQLDKLFAEWLMQGDKPTGWAGASRQVRIPSGQRQQVRSYVDDWRSDVRSRLAKGGRY